MTEEAVIPTENDVQETGAEVEAEVVETEVETEEITQTEEEKAEEAAKKRKSEKTQRRINKLTREKKEAQAEAAKYKQELQGYQKPVEPKSDDFEDYNDYINAKVDYEVARKTQSSEEATSEPKVDFQTVILEGKEKYSDFEQVALNPNLGLTQEMAEAIGESDVAADVFYHLGNNPVELERISLLDPIHMAREIGRLEVRLNKPKPRTTQTPAPVKPLADASSQPVDVSKMSMDEYAAHRNKVRWAQGKI